MVPHCIQMNLHDNAFQMVLALRYLHKEKGIVHRDLTPNNIMLGEGDKVTISKSPRTQLYLPVNTVECRCKAAQYNTIFHTALRWLKQNRNQSVKSQITPHILP